MRDPSRAETIRAALAALTCTSITATLARTTDQLVDGASRAGAPLDLPVAAVVVGLGTAAATLLATGCWMLTVASLAGRAAGPATWCERVGARLTPALLRRAVGLTVGAGLGVAALGGVASASEPDLGWEVTTGPEGAASPEAAQSATDPSVDGAQEPTAVPELPDTRDAEERIEGHLASQAPAPPDATEVDAGTVTVLRGDSLWRIAAAHLPGASDAEIAAAWPRWYEANRAVIGADPGLIHPGQVLRVPPDPITRPAP